MIIHYMFMDEAEKGLCSDVSGVQAGPGAELEAGIKSVSYKHDGLVAKPDQQEPDPIIEKVDVELKKPPDNLAKKKLIKAGDKVMKIVELM
ncbi:uncharacterized protein G2W53_014608 [Senna tora]|uniref:Uncharacterized protein n=1 Tax=Senna tora TaxID=362788 RepID=A0A835C606_9FABA|nr:uncharacterized protein G2W53_014608 [Senna tora]